MSEMNLYEQMFDANVRIECAWPFPVMNPSQELIGTIGQLETLPDQLLPLIKDWPEKDKDDLFSGGGMACCDAWDELCSYAFRRGMTGWIGVAATPILTVTSAHSASFSWGYYGTRLLFSETADGLLTSAINWAETQSEKAYEVFKAKEGRTDA